MGLTFVRPYVQTEQNILEAFEWEAAKELMKTKSQDTYIQNSVFQSQIRLIYAEF